jgi:hypothetical protein
MNEPSFVAIHLADHSVLAVGHEAKAMLGRTPGNITAIRPLKHGVIADFDVTEKMLHYFINKVHQRRTLVHPRIVIGVPSGITQVEKRAVRVAQWALGPPNARLIVSDIRPEQEAAHLLYRGVFGFLRNPAGHRLLGPLQPERVLQVVGMVDYLISIAEAARREKTQGSGG